jgi:hypothetical protein
MRVENNMLENVEEEYAWVEEDEMWGEKRIKMVGE